MRRITRALERRLHIGGCPDRDRRALQRLAERLETVHFCGPDLGVLDGAGAAGLEAGAAGAAAPLEPEPPPVPDVPDAPDGPAVPEVPDVAEAPCPDEPEPSGVADDPDALDDADSDFAAAARWSFLPSLP